MRYLLVFGAGAIAGALGYQALHVARMIAVPIYGNRPKQERPWWL